MSPSYSRLKAVQESTLAAAGRILMAVRESDAPPRVEPLHTSPGGFAAVRLQEAEADASSEDSHDAHRDEAADDLLPVL